MEIKDLAVDVERMDDVRGGGNHIAQANAIGPVASQVGVAGGHFNLSPVTIKSEVAQANLTNQGALIEDLYSRVETITLDRSQVTGGFGWWF